MNLTKIKFLIMAMMLTNIIAIAQDTLTLSDAIKIGMENNFSIRIARNDVSIADNNNTLGNAGFLPKVDASASSNNSFYNIKQEYADGTNYKNSSYPSYGLSGGVLLNWTLFDGFAMFANKQKYSTLEELSNINFQMTVEDAAASIIINYYTIAIENNLLENYHEALTLSRDRLRIAREKAVIGTSYQIAVMQAEVDYRADSSQMLQQVNKIQNLKINLNKLIGREPDINFNVKKLAPEVVSIELNTIIKNLVNQNKEIQAAKLNLRLKEIAIREAQASRYPRIGISPAYNFSRSSTPEGSTELNRSFGPAIGISAGITLFNGFNATRNIKNARIYRDNQDLINQSKVQNLKGEAIKYYNNLVLAKNLVELEQKSAELAKTNSNVAMEKYRIGIISDIELRDAQIKYLDAEYRYLNALMQAKTAEVELQVLMGAVNIP
ncbi:MAG: TolC family protein [Bacteroidales bacterium]|nr:MAG: TolC family protein [Bacteroidales bacterium]